MGNEPRVEKQVEEQKGNEPKVEKQVEEQKGNEQVTANAATIEPEAEAMTVTDGDQQDKQDTGAEPSKGDVEPTLSSKEDIGLGQEHEEIVNASAQIAEIDHKPVLDCAKHVADHEERIRALEAERDEFKKRLENLETIQSTPQHTMHPGPLSTTQAFSNGGKGKGHQLPNNPFSFVEELPAPEFVVKAESKTPYTLLGRLVPVAPVIDLQAQAPQDFQPGQKVHVDGPHGTIDVELPASIKGGQMFQCHLAPPPELKVTVPPGFIGSSLMFQQADGSHISVPVPGGKRPGDIFYVTPPALMVWVPQGAQAGELVSFSVRGGNGDKSKVEWFSARIPAKLYSGYFVACLPRPCWSEWSVVDELDKWIMNGERSVNELMVSAERSVEKMMVSVERSVQALIQ